MTRKELLLLLASTAATLLVAVGLIRWLAPGLLGGPRDLQLVQLSEEVPPFFEGVFRPEQFRTTEMLLKDPRTLNRPRPFHGELFNPTLGPHDVLGFRNRAVPAVADVLVIGDSQTYGNNVLLEENWPSRLAARLPGRSVYAMAAGGWGAVQYLDMFSNATAFRPRAIVVAFYTGNDPIDSFQMAYGNDLWRALRPDPKVSLSDAPSGVFPPPEAEWWVAAFAGGESAFTPAHRLLNNAAQPAVEAGYAVIRRVAEQMAQSVAQQRMHLVLTVVPTKELAFARRVAAEHLEAPPAYGELVRQEGARIEGLAQYFRALAGVTYVDVVGPLQEAMLGRLDLYPANVNGHPVAAGYELIGATVAAAIDGLLPPVPDGLVSLSENGGFYVMLVRDGEAWLFDSEDTLRANGWTDQPVVPVTQRDLAGLRKRSVPGVDRKRFGPRRR